MIYSPEFRQCCTSSPPETTPSSETSSTDESKESFPNESSERERIVAEEAKEEHKNGMTDEQRNSLNMLNYLTVLTKEINDSKGSRLYLEGVYSLLLNNIYPNAVDMKTQAHLANILDTLERYRMIAVKRERLEYIYEQNRAQAMRQVIQSPLSVLNDVQSGNWLKSAAAVVYMAVDSYASYTAYTQKTDMEYLQDGWELEDEEADELHTSRMQAFTYMLEMVRGDDLSGDYALNEQSVDAFVKWKHNSAARRIAFFESEINTYRAFGPYWLALAEGYFESGEYKKCLDAIEEYEAISTRIFRKDYEYAKILTIGISAAREIYETDEYAEKAEKYVNAILEHTDHTDWALRYFAAEVYLDLYAQTNQPEYEEKAYKIAFDNVNYLVDGQRERNAAYLSDVVEIEAPKGATKREKEEIKQYNKMLKAERKTALPPVSEVLYLNCELLFALADRLDIGEDEKKRIGSILHENGEPLFMVRPLDEKFWFTAGTASVAAEDITADFDGKKFSLPAVYVSEHSLLKVTVKEAEGQTVMDNWNIDEVTRKEGDAYTDFMAVYTSDTAKKINYADGMHIRIEVTPAAEYPDETIEFLYNVIGTKKLGVFNGVGFERITK